MQCKMLKFKITYKKRTISAFILKKSQHTVANIVIWLLCASRVNTENVRATLLRHRMRGRGNGLLCGCEQQGLTTVTGARGSGVGAGTWRTGFSQGTSWAAVEARLTFLAVGPLGVPPTVQTHSCRTEQRFHDYTCTWSCMHRISQHTIHNSIQCGIRFFVRCHMLQKIVSRQLNQKLSLNWNLIRANPLFLLDVFICLYLEMFFLKKTTTLFYSGMFYWVSLCLNSDHIDTAAHTLALRICPVTTVLVTKQLAQASLAFLKKSFWPPPTFFKWTVRQ